QRVCGEDGAAAAGGGGSDDSIVLELLEHEPHRVSSDLELLRETSLTGQVFFPFARGDPEANDFHALGDEIAADWQRNIAHGLMVLAVWFSVNPAMVGPADRMRIRGHAAGSSSLLRGFGRGTMRAR